MDPRAAGRGLRMRSRYSLIAVAPCDPPFGLQQAHAGELRETQARPHLRGMKSILGEPARCDDLVGFKSCRWGDESRNITVRFAGDQVVLYSAENVR